MMFTDATLNAVGDHWLRGIPWVPPTQIWVGLLTSAPSPDGTCSEVSIPGYARQPLHPGAANWFGTGREISGLSAGTTRTYRNALALAWSATSGTATSSHYGLFDAATGGLARASGAWLGTLTLAPGKPITAAPGAIAISLDRRG